MQRKAPLPGKIFARCILQRRFAGHFGCMARISCQSQPVFGCMARESCRELAVFPPEAAFGMHGAQNLPRIAARGRTAAESCHGKTPENASRENIAIVERPGTHQGIILPRPDARAERPARPCATAPAWPTAVAPSAPRLPTPPDIPTRVLQVVRALAVAQPADCRVAAERVVNIAKLVSVPQRRSATTPCATIPCAAAPQRHALQHHDAMHRTRRFCRR